MLVMRVSQRNRHEIYPFQSHEIPHQIRWNPHIGHGLWTSSVWPLSPSGACSWELNIAKLRRAPFGVDLHTYQDSDVLLDFLIEMFQFGFIYIPVLLMFRRYSDLPNKLVPNKELRGKQFRLRKNLSWNNLNHGTWMPLTDPQRLMNSVPLKTSH